jgi:hypothetical protein
VAPYGCVARTEAAREAVAIHFLELAAYVCYLPRIAERRRNREGRRIHKHTTIVFRLLLRLNRAWFAAGTLVRRGG